MKTGAYLSASVIIRWTSSVIFVILRIDSTTGGPMVRFGTKCPSMMSTWSMVAPPCSTLCDFFPQTGKIGRENRWNNLNHLEAISMLSQRQKTHPRRLSPECAGRHSRNSAPASSTTASFSSVSSEQVEYTRRPPGARTFQSIPQQPHLPLQVRQSAGSSRHLISGFRASVPVPEHGCIHKNAIETHSKTAAAGCVQHNQSAAECLHGFQTAQMHIAGNSAHARFQGLRGFIPGCGANIQKRWPGNKVEQRHDCLRADILNPQTIRRATQRW